MNYIGVIIEESLVTKNILGKVKILKKRFEPITAIHKTPWLKRWTLDNVEVDEEIVEEFAELVSHTLDYSKKSAWYADFKNDKYHFIIFKNKIFKVDLKKPSLYKNAKEYGISLGIPKYQVDFV